MKAIDKQKIALLRQAKKNLKNEQNIYICTALQSASNSYPNIYESAKCELTDYILLLVGKDASGYENWLRRAMPDLPRDEVSMRQYRIQWIDWMIASLNGLV